MRPVAAAEHAIITHSSANRHEKTALTTVGFGDIIPITIAGKFLTVLTAMVGILLSALVIASIHSQLSLSSQQAYAVKAMQIERLREKERGSKDWLLGTSQLAVVQSRMTEGTWRSTLRGAERDAKEAWQLASACLPWRLPAETRRELQGGGLRQRLQAELAQ